MAQRIVAAGLLMALAPLLTLVAIVIAVVDGRPVLFRQARLGRGKEEFEILKLRTMGRGSREGKVTRTGRALRASGIDELPQLVNIARGEMRFIGPRPLTAADVDRLGWGGASHASRWAVPPGLTGYAQLAPRCDRELSWAMDAEYAARRTPWFDLRLTVASGAVLVLGKRRVKALMFP